MVGKKKMLNILFERFVDGDIPGSRWTTILFQDNMFNEVVVAFNLERTRIVDQVDSFKRFRLALNALKQPVKAVDVPLRFEITRYY